MAHCVISDEHLYAFLASLLENLPVMGPRQRPDQPGFYQFDWLQAPEEFVASYTTTTLPPKAAFFPPNEELFSFTLDHRPQLGTIHDKFAFVLAGVHPCDLAAIEALDQAYAHPPADVRWLVNRKRATVIGIDCLPDEYCFCTTMGTSAFRKTCDLFLTRIERGYLVEILSDAGKALLKHAETSSAGAKDLKDASQWREQKDNRITAAFDVSIGELAEILAKGGLTEVWRAVAERCYSCGSCNTTCPACFCFNLVDGFDANLTQGIRRRTWDSCQLPDFAVVAGGHNFRGDRWQRVKHRWHRKFLYLYRQFGRPFCTGCGRCSRACTADINIVDVTNQLIAASSKETPGA
jgi:sulfhydrogenase subunit beta (sulfur reductase)